MYKRLVLFFLGVGFFLSFLLFSYIVHKDKLVQTDFNTTVKLQDRIPRKMDEPFSLLSDVGHFEVTMVMVLGIMGFLAWKKKWLGAIGVFGFFGVFHLVEIFGKVFVDHKPPMQFMIRTVDQLQFPQFEVRQTNSYPSGHSGRAAFISLIIGILVIRSKKLVLWQKLAIIAFLVVYDIVMFTSRVYLGEHWMTDVVGGAILGFAFAFLAAVAL